MICAKRHTRTGYNTQDVLHSSRASLCGARQLLTVVRIAVQVDALDAPTPTAVHAMGVGVGVGATTAAMGSLPFMLRHIRLLACLSDCGGGSLKERKDGRGVCVWWWWWRWWCVCVCVCVYV